MRWLVALFLFCSTAAAETLTTDNVLPDMSGFSTSGSTSNCATGAYCTGNATAGGGTYTSSFDVPLTKEEVQAGFTLNSSVTVDSHSSNSVLATCTSITQTSDCRDIFRLTVALFDDTNTVVEKFEREVELDFGGLRTFSFEDTVAENSYSILTGQFELYGVDAGYHGGFYGPRFSDPSLTFTYQDVVEQQILDQIVSYETQLAMAPAPEPPPPEPESPPPQPSSTTAPRAENSEPLSSPEEPAPPTVEPVSAPQPEQRREEEQAEAQVEAEVAAEVEASPRPEQPQAQPRTRQEKVKAAAQRVVRKIAPSQRYNAASQTTTLVVMNLLAAKIASGPSIEDTAGFFPKETLEDNRSLSDPRQDYLVFGASNASHEAFLRLEWGR